VLDRSSESAGAVSEDIGNLIADSVADGPDRPGLLPEIDQAVTGPTRPGCAPAAGAAGC
jgi:hypothetical protein